MLDTIGNTCTPSLKSHKYNNLNEMLDGINFEVRASIDLPVGQNHLIQVL